MRIVLVSNWFSENMGYSENVLPKALAALGHDVHVITSTAQVYFDSPFYASTYQQYLGSAIQPTGTKHLDGYTLHRLPLRKSYGICIEGLVEKVRDLNPQIVQTFDIDALNVYPLAVACQSGSFRLFTEMHLHASVYPGYRNRNILQMAKWYWRLGRYLPTINDATVLCYPIADDCADIAKVIYRVPAEKIKVQSLGTDTQLFKPVTEESEKQRRQINREKWGFAPHHIVCIYTGRITADKGPGLLAEAIRLLHQQGHTQFVGFFVGTGTSEELTKIRETPGCVLHDFVQAIELPAFYQAADMAVWPLQESTSQLDAMACGLPVIINNTVTVADRVSGNGALYRKGDPADLAQRLLEFSDTSKRQQFGVAGTEKARRQYSWLSIAEQRIADYQASLQS